MDLLSEKISDIAKAATEGTAPSATGSNAITLSMADVSERLTALEAAVRDIQEKMAPPTTTKAGLDYANIMPTKGGKRNMRKTQKNRRIKKRC